MNKSLLIVLFLLPALTGKAQTSVYHHFPDSNAVWGMVSVCMETSCGDWEYIQDYYDGDTVIGAYLYKKINEEVLMVTSGSCCQVPGTVGPVFIREDTVARKVYFRTALITSDSLLYDFTLNIGDTLKGFFGDYGMGLWTVQSVDSVLVGDTYRKRINFDTSETIFYFSIIEGVGSTTGLTALYWGHFEMGTSLQCFSVNGDIKYTYSLNPDTIACGTLPVNLFESVLNDLTVYVFPNPAQDVISIKSGLEPFPLFVSIFSFQGKFILEKQVQPDECEIDIATLPPGIYFIEARGERVLRGKFVKE
ncbi:MAG: T9SS type A sorting domain-containing protein [Bacteroidales bacterium]